jgi:hypothetical protein
MTDSNWFKQLFGFEESSYDVTQQNFKLIGSITKPIIQSKVNGRKFLVGYLSTLTLKELKDHVLNNYT